MQYRTLGRCGINVSEIGFGAWGIGGSLWKGGSDTEAIKALHRACDLGLHFIDTALAYGQGHSEQLIGSLLKERKERVYVATKIPPKNQEWPARKGVPVSEVFPNQHIIACTEQSLKNLGVEQLDLQQLHVWSENWLSDLGWYHTLLKLQKEGKIARFGISINDHSPDSALEVVRREMVDSVQVIYNIFDPTPAQNLFPLCREKNIGVIARCPFDEGALTGAITETTRFEPGDWRARYFTKDRRKEVVARVDKLKGLLKDAQTATLSELALRFCLSHPDVSTVIPGMRTVSHVNQNMPVSDGIKLSQEVLDPLALQSWQRNFYD
jgi:aryl-alcohol dehydrogenase-like predicted oxidoreductase